MKTPSRYVLAVEILIIVLFHVVKIKQSEKHTAEMAFTPDAENIHLHKPVTENNSGVEYMFVNLVK